jgi:methionyl-tRNA formyltransferase
MRLVMMGTGTFAEPLFEALFAGSHQIVGLVTQPDRAVGAERGSTRQVGRGLKAIALEHGVPVYQPESINTPEGVAAIQAWRPDLLVVAAYGQILSKDVLSVPPRGGINVHASLLPKYRGAAPVAWAIAAGEKETGVTIIRMSVALDAGDMLAQETLEIGPEETAGELESRLAIQGSRLALEVVERIASGTAAGIPQDKSQATKAPKLTKEHGLIDWTKPADAIGCHVRAMQPWPTAYSYWYRAGQAPVRIIVCRAVALLEASSAPPGDLLIRPDETTRMLVACGGGSIVEILELQPAGRKRMAAADYLRGRRLEAGDRLGSEAP